VSAARATVEHATVEHVQAVVRERRAREPDDGRVRPVKPDPRDDDDLDLLDELPELPSLGDDEVVGVEGGVEDELDDDDEKSAADPADPGKKSSVLDDEEGPAEDFDDPIEVTEGSMLDESRDATLDLGEDDVDADGEEYGWTGGDEAPGASALDFVEDVEEPETTSEDDGGAEGVEESPTLAFEGDDAPAGLPPMRRDEESGDDLADDLDLEDDGAIELDLPPEDEARLMGASLPPPRSTEAHVRYHGAVVDVSLAGEALYLVGDELARVTGSGAEACPAVGLGAEELLSVSVRGELVAVGTRLGGLFRSMDAGRTFQPANAWRSGNEPSVGCRVAGDAAGRLWLWAGGALYRSDDFGARFVGPVLPAPVIDANLDDSGAFVVACGSLGGGIDVLRASEDGRGFRAIVPAATGLARAAGAIAVAVAGDRVALAQEGDANGPLVHRGGRWSRVPELAGCHALAWVGEVLYGATNVASGDRGLVLACAFRAAGDDEGEERDVSVVFDLDALPRVRSGSSSMQRRAESASSSSDAREWLGEGVPEEHRIFAIRPRGDTLLVACGAGLVELALGERAEPS
jgi:hypothetical protein